MLSFARPLISAVSALSGLALLGAAGASAQEDPFSILAPRPQAAPAQAERPPIAAAHLDRYDYLELRGVTDEGRLITSWRVEQTLLDGTPVSSETREIGVSRYYAYEQTEDDRSILDLATNRLLHISEAGVRNTAVAAHVHRQMETFTRFTNNGTLSEITGPGGAVFERFWIEAALGIRATEVTIYGDTAEDGTWLLRRRPDTPPIISITPGETGSDAQVDAFAAWLRHNAPIHPDALGYFADLAHLPQSFSFIVFSPTSPDGRRETWTLEEYRSVTWPLPWPEAAERADISAYDLPNDAMSELIDRGQSALLEAAASDPEKWTQDAETLALLGDKAGAYLTLHQAGQHFGACTPATNTPVCSALNRLIIGSLGDAAMEALVTTVSAGLNDPAMLMITLQPFLSRTDKAGAAANLLSAQAAAALESRGAAGAPDAIALFMASAEADPASPMIYWHAGRYAATNGDIDTAWMLFDIARSLPDPMSDNAHRDAGALEARLRSVAPAYFAADLQSQP